MTQKGNLPAVCVLVLLLELTSLVPGQQCSSTYQAIPWPPGRDGRDGNDGSPGTDGRDGSPAVFTHEDFLKLKEMLINEGVYCSQNCSTPSPSTTVTQTVTTTQVVHSTATCPTPTPSPVPTVTEYLTMNQTVTTTQVVPSTATQTVTTTQVVHSTATCPTPTPSPVLTVTEYLTMNQTVTTTQVVHSTATCPTPTPEVQRDCQEFLSNGSNQSGVYTIQPDSLQSFDVYCDMDTDGGGWTVFQRRQDGSVDFYRNWDNYTAGFGNLSGEFWLGLDKINRLTNASSSELRVDLGNQTRYAKYSSFQVGDASTNYTLTVSEYSGTDGDALDYHNGMQFTTYDRDNDEAVGISCAIWHSKGAWWYNNCANSNLNGQYMPDSEDSGLRWRSLNYLRFTEMKVRRSN